MMGLNRKKSGRKKQGGEGKLEIREGERKKGKERGFFKYCPPRPFKGRSRPN